MSPLDRNSSISVRQNGHIVPIVGNVLRRSPTLAKRGVLMEHHAIGPSQFPRREAQSHVVYLHTGAPVQAEVESRSISGRRLIRPGTVWVMPHGSEHAVSFRDKVEGLSISFDPTRFSEFFASAGEGEPCPLKEGLSDEKPQLRYTMWALWHESLVPAEPGLLAAEGLARVLAQLLIYTPGAERPSRSQRPSGLSGRQLTTVLELVRDNVSEPLSLQRMADAAGLSSFHFLRAFKATTGCTPHQFVLQQRIEAARSLLRDSRKTISEVSVLVGFPYPSHFARAFRQVVGVSPNEFRRSN